MSNQIEHWDRLSSHPPDASVIDPKDVRGHKNRYITGLRNSAILESLPSLGESMAVLDFGCGTGGLSAALVQSGRKVVGVDISSGLLARTPERGLDEKAVFVRFDGRHLPLADESLDSAVTYVVLNHITEDAMLADVLLEIRRVLAPGGRLIAIEQVRRRATQDPVSWQHRRTLPGFVALFESAGFRIASREIIRYGRIPSIQAVRLGLVPQSAFPALWRLERRIGRWLGVLPWDYCDVRFEAIKS